MYPLRRTTVAPPSESREFLDREERVEPAELEGVETERSRSGTASRASEGDTLSDGESGRVSGEAMLLAGGLGVMSAIVVVVGGWLLLYRGRREGCAELQVNCVRLWFSKQGWPLNLYDYSNSAAWFV